MKRRAVFFAPSVALVLLCLGLFLSFRPNEVDVSQNKTIVMDRDDEGVDINTLVPAVSSDSEKYEAESRKLKDELATLKKQLHLLNERLGKTDQKLASIEEEKQIKMDDSGKTRVSKIPTDQEQATLLEEELSSLSSRLLSESVDSQWADETIDALEVAMEENTELKGFDIVQTTCMTTLCKLELNIDTNSSKEEVLQRLSIHRPWKGETTFSVKKDGYTQIIFAREGYSLGGNELE